MRIGGTEVLTLTQAAQRSGLSANTLRTQVKNGVLPATLAGKTYLVTADDLDRYISEHKGRHGVANPTHPLYGKRGGGGRRKKMPAVCDSSISEAASDPAPARTPRPGNDTV